MIGLLLAGTPAEAAMRLHDAATVAKTIVQPAQQTIEKKIGLPLKIVANGFGNGLQDLSAGRADVAMIAAPLEVEANIVNRQTPGALDPSSLKVFPVGRSAVRTRRSSSLARRRATARGLRSRASF